MTPLWDEFLESLGRTPCLEARPDVVEAMRVTGRAQDAKGRARYGEPLTEATQGDWCEHVAQELADATVYADRGAREARRKGEWDKAIRLWRLCAQARDLWAEIEAIRLEERG